MKELLQLTQLKEITEDFSTLVSRIWPGQLVLAPSSLRLIGCLRTARLETWLMMDKG